MVSCEAWASFAEPLHWPQGECGGSYRSESRGVPWVMRSQGVARGTLLGGRQGMGCTHGLSCSTGPVMMINTVKECAK
jgi:hypothetical protein